MMPFRKNKYLLVFILLALVAGIGLNKFYAQPQKTAKQAPKKEQTAKPESKKPIPQKVYKVLEYITLHQQAMDGYEGGREFKNREKQLPANTQANQRIRYREWDVNPKIPGQNRGAERLVTGDDRSAWYTENHYQSFTKIK